MQKNLETIDIVIFKILQEIDGNEKYFDENSHSEIWVFILFR